MYKPWQKEYEKLLNDLCERFQGEILPVQSGHSNETTFSMNADMYAYPRYKGVINGLTVFLEISATPCADASMFEMTNVEYLRIYVLQETHHKVFVRHEGIIDKVQKKMALNNEHETGNKKFDNEYFLYHNNADDIPLLDSSDFQSFVESLEPFESVEISHGGMVVCDEIDSPDVLTVQHVTDRISKIGTVAESIH